MTNQYLPDSLNIRKPTVWKPYQTNDVCVPPTAEFSVDVTTPTVNTEVQFTDETTGNPPIAWVWDFGDGNTSTQQNPTHTYTVAGTYTVTLAVTNACGAAFEVKAGYIVVAPDVSLLLDQVAFDIFYALVRVRAAYTGPLIRVRNSATDVETDIGYDGDNKLDEAALTAAIGSDTGYVVTWYDQSGNGKHLQQATASKQPKLVNSGTYLTYVLADGVDDEMTSSSFIMATPTASVASVGIEVVVATPGKFSWYVGNPVYRCLVDGFLNKLVYGRTDDYVVVNHAGTTEAVRISLWDKSDSQSDRENFVYVNGTLQGYSYIQGNALLDIGTGVVQMFSSGGANYANCQRRAWGFSTALLTPAERAIVDAYAWN